MPDQETDISRVARSRRETQAAYDRLSRWYDLVSGEAEWTHVHRALDRLAVEPGESVLEIGCGTGRALVALAQAVGSAGDVHGLDLSPGMLLRARARIGDANTSARVLLTCGDAACLPYAAASFDAIFMSFTLELFDTPEIPIVLGECRRVLRPGGRMGVVSLSRASGLTLLARLYEWGHRHFPALLDCRLIYAERSLSASGFATSSAERTSMWGLPIEVVVARRLGPGD